MESDVLERECRTFTRYLLGRSPTPYVISKYLEAHRISREFSRATRFDRLLLVAGRRHWLITKISDSYARLAAPGSLLRRKLILLLAILETSPQFSRTINAVDEGGKKILLARLLLRGASFAGSLVLGFVLFLPAHLLLGAGGRQTS